MLNHKLFLDLDILIIRHHWKKMKKNFGKVLSNFENIMENGAFALKDSIFCKIFK